MPAYGKQITPAEMTILVDFLVSLRPEGTKPAGWATPDVSLGEAAKVESETPQPETSKPARSGPTDAPARDEP
jgi:hypothetical protein